MKYLYLIVFFGFINCSLIGLTVSNEEMNQIAARIYTNECSGKPENLVHWNQGEEFLSLGIGHFIWYPEGYKGPFEEQFPRFIQYCKDNHVALIPLLQKHAHCPWKSKESFLNQKSSQDVADLRAFLLDTRRLQAKFMAVRLSQALAKMTTTLPDSEKERVTKRFTSLATLPQGLYALLDYVNFKGEGIQVKERYNGQGWGLLQVLQMMQDTNSDPLDAFRQAAKAVLTQRVNNAPIERNESRWLQGWHNRIDTYTTQS